MTPSRQPTGDRVLLIGIDGATWDVMRPLMEAGELPTFARLVREGWSGKLRSLEPMVSPMLWTSIATGKTQEKHGITGFLAPLTAGGPPEVPVTSNIRRTETLWTITSRWGRTVDVVGWYVTWPVEPVHGVMVSDRFTSEDRGPLEGGIDSLTPDKPGVYPASLAPELAKLFVTPDKFLDPVERDLHRMFKIYPVDATRAAIAERLMKEYPADLTMVYFWGTDAIQHRMWKFYQPDTYVGDQKPTPAEIAMNRLRIPRYYGDIDGFVARLVALTGPRDTVLIVSDHGFGPATRADPKWDVSGDHRPDGIIIAWGNHVRQGTAHVEPSVLDVTPTVLYLLGLPTGEDMDGHVATELIAPEFLRAHPVQTIATYEEGRFVGAQHVARSPMDEEMKDRLRRLGYIQ